MARLEWIIDRLASLDNTFHISADIFRAVLIWLPMGKNACMNIYWGLRYYPCRDFSVSAGKNMMRKVEVFFSFFMILLILISSITFGLDGIVQNYILWEFESRISHIKIRNAPCNETIYYLWSVLAFGHFRYMRLSMCASARPCINPEFVYVITCDPFKPGSPTLDQRCKQLKTLKIYIAGCADCPWALRSLYSVSPAKWIHLQLPKIYNTHDNIDYFAVPTVSLSPSPARISIPITLQPSSTSTSASSSSSLDRTNLIIISRSVSGFATGSPCGVWGRRWTTCVRLV